MPPGSQIGVRQGAFFQCIFDQVVHIFGDVIPGITGQVLFGKGNAPGTLHDGLRKRLLDRGR